MSSFPCLLGNDAVACSLIAGMATSKTSNVDCQRAALCTCLGNISENMPAKTGAETIGSGSVAEVEQDPRQPPPKMVTVPYQRSVSADEISEKISECPMVIGNVACFSNLLKIRVRFLELLGTRRNIGRGGRIWLRRPFRPVETVTNPNVFTALNADKTALFARTPISGSRILGVVGGPD